MGFRSPVLHAVWGEEDTVHGDHLLGSLGPERQPVIDIDRAAWRRRARQKYFLPQRHRRPSCQTRLPPRSGQVLVRTYVLNYVGFPRILGGMSGVPTLLR